MNKQTYRTAVRFLFVIDLTGSMDDFSIMIKGFLKNAYQKIIDALGDAGREVEQIEVQLATFRDFFEESGDEAFHMSNVFNLSNEKEAFGREVDALNWMGGGDDPESSLQALHMAIKRSEKMETDATKKRFIVFLFTDNPSHSFDEIEKRGGIERYPNYPIDELPKTLDEFYGEYHNTQGGIFEKGVGVKLKEVRLNIFAPENASPFDADHIGGWNNVTTIPIRENGALDDVTENLLLATIVASC